MEHFFIQVYYAVFDHDYLLSLVQILILLLSPYSGISAVTVLLSLNYFLSISHSV